VLGEKWLGAIPLMPWLGLFAALYGVVRTLDMFLLATGGERASSLLALAFALFLLPVLWYVGRHGSVVDVAAAKAVSAILLVFALSYVVTRLSTATLSLIWTAVWPPMLASLTMFAAVKLLQAELPIDGHVVGLFRDAAVGAVVYAATSALTWLARGRPAGVEQAVVDGVKRRFYKPGGE
jgi:O-antigen/teichoic acid export membrane protein